MRILIVSGSFPPRNFGGVTASTYKLANSLQQKGHDVTVFANDTGNDENTRLDVKIYSTMNGIKVYYFKNLNNKLAFKYRFHTPVGFLSQLRKDIASFDIIAVQDFRSLMSIFVHHFARKNKIPYIIQARGSLPYEEGNYYFKKGFDFFWGKNILKHASRTIALSKTEADQYEKLGVERKKIEIIPNGIDVAEYQTLPRKGAFLRKHNFPPNEKIILSLGRLNKIKGLDLLITAFSKFSDKISNVSLIIAGPDDGDLPRLKSLVNELNISEKVHFIGPVYGTDKIEAYCDASVFVLPSVYDAFPNTVIESFACGTPVIATTGCHIADIVREAGIVVEYNPDRLMDAILTVITDDALAKRLGEKGRALVFNHYDKDVIIDSILQIYQKSVKIG